MITFEQFVQLPVVVQCLIVVALLIVAVVLIWSWNR